MLQTFKKLFKRQSGSLTSPSWLPYRNNDYSLSGVANRRLTSLGVVSHALRVYADACTRFPLRVLNKDKQPIDHYLLKVFESPNEFQNCSTFFNHLVTNVLLTGNFLCKIENDSSGRITSLLPFVSGSMWAYPSYRGGVANDFSDPILIAKHGFFYKDYRSRVFMPFEVLHIKDITYSSDLLNGISRITIARISFESGVELQETIKGISEGGLIPATVLHGPMGRSKVESDKFRENLETFFQNGLTRRRRFLTLPEGWKTEPLALSVKESDLKFIKTASDLDMAKIFNLQTVFSLESSQVQSGAKEAYRALLHIALRPFLQNLEFAFNKQLLSESERQAGVHFHFNSDFSGMDDRERSTALGLFRERGILTANECRELLKFPARSGGDELEAIKLEQEKIKLEKTEQGVNNES